MCWKLFWATLNVSNEQFALPEGEIPVLSYIAFLFVVRQMKEKANKKIGPLVDFKMYDYQFPPRDHDSFSLVPAHGRILPFSPSVF